MTVDTREWKFLPLICYTVLQNPCYNRGWTTFQKLDSGLMSDICEFATKVERYIRNAAVIIPRDIRTGTRYSRKSKQSPYCVIPLVIVIGVF